MSEMIIAGMDLQYNSNTNKHNLNISILTETIPKDYNDVFRLMASMYLKDKGVNITIDELLEKHYPESLI